MLDVTADGTAEVVGTISSGNFSPTLGHGIALAFLDPSVQVGQDLAIDVRGQSVPATCVALPFVAKK